MYTFGYNIMIINTDGCRIRPKPEVISVNELLAKPKSHRIQLEHNIISS